jgi:hypothetical protein
MVYATAWTCDEIISSLRGGDFLFCSSVHKNTPGRMKLFDFPPSGQGGVPIIPASSSAGVCGHGERPSRRGRGGLTRRRGAMPLGGTACSGGRGGRGWDIGGDSVVRVLGGVDSTRLALSCVLISN